ncbi:DUF6919 domain-containing protein [Petropleomorpha daqingensis]|uniref:DUF6919 domain-containing protein n=1 Tax=Petropleomorpha daqingensis TaxID=2026353 RepID=A0A853CCH9_9ACTN|nr:hypothetical protein [Petropleomorpha daqingensis]NYJ04831.1 hypothetical protein [Petropleomorpha daqingensis]
MPAHLHDSDDTCPACLPAWQQAGSVSRLRELTARFIEGRLRAHPHYLGATVAGETEHLVDVLAEINRAGLLTHNSQPGEDDEGWLQRAWVHGYATEAVVDALAAGCLGTDLLVLALPPGVLDGARVCVTRDGAHEGTWAGAFDDPVSVFGTGSGQLAAQLARLWCVDVIDPVWGRDDVLWAAVRRALAARPARRFLLEPGEGHACSVHS